MCVRAFIGSAALRSHFPLPFLQGRVEGSSSIDAHTQRVNIINREDNVTSIGISLAGKKMAFYLNSFY